MGVLNDLYHVVKFEYTPLSEVIGVGEDDFNGTASVTLEGGASWKEIELTPGTATVGEEQLKGDRRGEYYRQRFSGSMPARLGNYPGNLKTITKEPVVCRLTISNGKVFIAGNIHIPVRLNYRLESEGHDATVNFSRESKYPLLEEA
jgi:hypothetical protein